MAARRRSKADADWETLERRVVACRRCPRLREHCAEVARVRRRAYHDEVYWGRPVPGFGDRRARILLVGLAPAAHGANRTGRMFTGDRSGEWLYGALYRAGLANRPGSVARDDGLRLDGAYITAVCRCAPPDNKPSPDEMASCEHWLDRELELLRGVRVTLALGKIAWDAMLRRAARIHPLGRAGLPRPRPAFAHGAEARLVLRRNRPPVWLLGGYHPSQQNTFTRRLTRSMLDAVMERARTLAFDDSKTRPRGKRRSE